MKKPTGDDALLTITREAREIAARYDRRELPPSDIVRRDIRLLRRLVGSLVLRCRLQTTTE